MVENQDLTEKSNSEQSKEVDLLGEEGSDSEEFDIRDFSARSLKTTATVR